MKKLLAMLLCVAMALTLLPTVTFAEGETAEHVHCVCGKHDCEDTTHEKITYEPWSEAIKDTNKFANDNVTGEVNVYLDGNTYIDSELSVYAGATLNLCLNGYTMDVEDNQIEVGGKRANAAYFNLCDCDSEGTGKFTGGKSDAAIEIANGIFTMYSGAISGNTNRAIYIDRYSKGYTAEAHILGGTISGNSTTWTDGGGAICVQDGDLVIDGNAVISENSANKGGAITISPYYDTASLTIGGEAQIINNTATSQGGAIYTNVPADSSITPFLISGNTKINGNKAKQGGALCINGCAIEIAGNVQITGNFSTEVSNNNQTTYYGAVTYRSDKGIKIAGNVTIYNNYVENTTTQNNLAASYALIDLTKLENGAKIGIYSIKNAFPAENKPLQVSIAGTPEDVQKAVKSDTPGFSATRDDAGIIYLDVAPAHVHDWSTEWSTSDTHHWHACTADDCPLEVADYPSEQDSCYGEHVYDQEVKDEEFEVYPASCMAAGKYYKSCVCGKKGTETFIVSSPAHQFEYTVDGAKIKERCIYNCFYYATATITLPKDLVYDGNTKAANVGITGSEYNLEDGLTLSYTKNGSAVTEVVDAGDYTAVLTFIDKQGKDPVTYQATLDFTVEKQPVAAPTIAGKEYNGSTQTADVPESSLYTVTKNAGGTGVGEYNVVLTLANTDNYKWQDADGAAITLKFEITKQKNLWTTTPGIANWTYGDTPGEPVGAALSGEPTFLYFDSAKQQLSGKPSDAGNYYMVATAEGANHGKITTDHLPFAILQKEITLTWTAPEPLTYDGNAKTPSVQASGFVNDEEVAVEIALTQGCDNVNAGTFTFYALPPVDSNYKLPADAASPAYTITARALSASDFTVDADGLVYNGEAHEPTVASGNALVTENDYTVSYADNIDAGTDTAKVIITGKGNASGEIVIPFTIAPKSLTPAIEVADAGAYTGEAKTPAVVVKDGDTVLAPSEYTVTYTDNVNAGEATVTITDNPGGSYDIVQTSKTFTIAKAAYDMSGVTFADASYPYDGTEKTLTITGTLPAGVSVSYANNTRTRVGTVTATASFTGDAANYEPIADMTANLTITTVTFPVTLHANGGTLAGNLTSYTYGSGAALPAASRDRYTFDGWYATPDFTGAPVTTIGPKEYGAKTFWAKWTYIPSFITPTPMPTPSAPTIPPIAAILPFTDVPASAWYYDDVYYVYQYGLMNGTGAGKFSPDLPLNRAMLVTTLYRLAGEPVVGTANAFSDLPEGQWYTAPMKWAVSTGIIRGYGDGTCRPLDPITREEALAVLRRYAGGAASGDAAGYTCSDWAVADVAWAVKAGLLDGLDMADLTRDADRAEIAALLHRFAR